MYKPPDPAAFADVIAQSSRLLARWCIDHHAVQGVNRRLWYTVVAVEADQVCISAVKSGFRCSTSPEPATVYDRLWVDMGTGLVRNLRTFHRWHPTSPLDTFLDAAALAVAVEEFKVRSMG